MALLLLSVCTPYASADSGDTPAKDLSRYIQIEQSAGHPYALTKLKDNVLTETIPYKPYETIRVRWNDAPETPAYFCIQWGALPDRITLRQSDASGNLLSETIAESVYDTIIALSPKAECVTILPNASGMDLARIALFSEGSLPAPFFQWNDTPKGMDYLIVSTHPDDDVLFMGGIIPTYGAELGYVGTVAYVTTPSRLRVNEANLCVWEMGSTYRPLFLGFPDILPTLKDTYSDRFSKEAVTLALVRMLRAYRPLVVFSHDVKGEYGHWQHKIVSASVVDACRFCADPTYDSLSYAQFGTWQIQKCYLHLYADNPLEMEIQTPLPSRGNRTAFEVAQDAFMFHKSQQTGRHIVEDENGRYAMNRFGMAYGTVEAGNDVFDNIDPKLLSSYTLSEPSPTPAPSVEPMTMADSHLEPVTAVFSPSPDLSLASTHVPSASPLLTGSPSPFEQLQKTNPESPALRLFLPILCFLFGAAVVSACFLLFGRRKRR